MVRSANRPAGADLGDGRGEPLGLSLVARLGGDVGRLGADRERRDGQPLEHPVRVVAEQRPVLERARLALGGVAHREPPARPGVADARPLPAGREPAAAPTPQPAVGDHTDDGVLAGRDRRREGLPAASAPVLLQRGDRIAIEQHARHAPRVGDRRRRTVATR